MRKQEQKAIELEQKAREMISHLTMDNLLNEWELTSKRKPCTALAMVREWLMDEVESRNQEAFYKWLDGNARDEELRNYIEG